MWSIQNEPAGRNERTRGVRPASWIRNHSIALGLAIRIVTASVLTFAICQLLELEQSQWAVLSAIIVMQSTVGASLKATLDRFAGSIGGAFWGVCVLVALPRDTVLDTAMALVATLVPLAAVAAFKPAYRIAPITGVILLLTPMLADKTPWSAGMDRIIEVCIGSIVALAVALIVFPVRAHQTLAQLAADTLNLLADLTEQIQQEMIGGGDTSLRTELHHKIRHAITEAENAAEAAMRERASYLLHAPDPQPICRTLRRLRNDLTMIGRTLDGCTPPSSLQPLTQKAGLACGQVAEYLRLCAEALVTRKPSPSMSQVEEAVAAHAESVAQARQDGAARHLPDEQVGRIFGLAFGFAQLNGNLRDLASRTDEFARMRIMRRARPAR